MDTSQETWRPVVGFEQKFEVSNLGLVKSLSHEVRHWRGQVFHVAVRIVTQSRHSGGYLLASLDGKKHYVHRLVMQAFVGDGEGKDVNHIDGNKTNNRLSNLEYCDRLHNVRHAIANGLQDNAGEANGMNKFSESQIRATHRMVQRGATCAAAARRSGLSQAMVQQIVKGVRWKHLGLPVLT